MRINKIKLNHFKGVSGEFDLSALNLAVGPNGSGKTALLQAIQWAIEGRTQLGGTLEATAQLAHVTGCAVTVTVDDGFSWTRSLERNNRENVLTQHVAIAGRDGLSAKSAQAAIAEHIGKDGELFAPMFDLRNFLDLSEDRRRDFVMGLCARATADVLPSDIMGQITHQYLILELGEGTVRSNPDEMALFGMLAQSTREAYEQIGKEVSKVASVIAREGVAAGIAAAAEIVRRIALTARTTKDQARQAARRLADEKAGARIVAENLDTLEARLASTQKHIGELGEQIAHQDGRAKARTSLQCTIELNQTTIRDYINKTVDAPDLSRLPELEAQLAAPQTYSYPDLDAARELARQRTADLSGTTHRAATWEREGRDRQAQKQRLTEERGRLAQDPWTLIKNELAKAVDVLDDTIPAVASKAIRTAYELAIQHAADSFNRIYLIDEDLAKLETAIVEAATYTTEAKAAVEAASTALADANRRVAECEQVQRALDAQRREDETKREGIRRVVIGLQQAKLNHEARERDIRAAQDAMLDAQRRLDELDAQGGYVPVAELESQRKGLTDQAALIQHNINAKRQALATDEQLTKCLAAAERDEVLHRVAEQVRDAIRAVRETLMVQLVEPLLGHMRAFLSDALGEGCVPYCRLEKDNGKPIFELGWTVGDRRVSEPALSGGERALFGAALAYALVRLADPPLKVLMIEGAELDESHLASLLTGLAKDDLDGNVIVATYAQMGGWELGPWQTISLGKEEAVAVAS